MKISYNWLKDYLNTDLSPEEVSKILTNTGLEVEGMESFESIKGGLEGFVIGEVKECKKHPNADKLSLTKVDIGTGEELPIVCGAPNVAEGQKVVVATVGTTLYTGDKEFKIKKAKMRGEVSEGMICAEDEMGLGDSHEGIMVLQDDVKTGTPAKEYFEIERDVVFEIGLTPNRIDGASHIGTARDLAAFLQSQDKDIKLKKPDVDEFKVDHTKLQIPVSIENPDACPRYTAITMTNLKVGPSPKWLQNRLQAIGLKPINNLVDISNYVLHETGHPLHFFDADKIKGGKVIVKTLENKTPFLTLDNEKRELSHEDLMICDAEGGMCIAGVYGGIDSGVTENTKNLFIESAYFNPVYIRKTAKRHTLHTDASFRFERGADPNNTVFALKRAAMLIKELAGGEISSDIIDEYPKKIENEIVDFSYRNMERLIGQPISKEKVKSILESLDVQILEDKEETLKLEIPTYRTDVTREVDVIEEILRIYGYDTIEVPSKLNSSMSYREKPDMEFLQNQVSDLLSNNGFHEIMSNSLTKPAYYENLKTYSKDKLVNIFNPLSQDLGAMRESLLFGGLEAIQYNKNRKNPNLRLYEFGNVYWLDNSVRNEDPLKKYKEEPRLALFLHGLSNTGNWTTSKEATSFYEIRSFIDNILERLGFDKNKLEVKETSSELFREGLDYNYNNKTIASFGMISNAIKVPFDIEEEVYYGHLAWHELVKTAGKHQVIFKPVPKYPAVRRDLALLLDKHIKFSQIYELAKKTEKKLLKQIELFDVFEGKQIGENKKSYAVSFVLQDESKTLKDKQIDKIMKNLIRSFEQELGAQIR